jgi:hypothetical protein
MQLEPDPVQKSVCLLCKVSVLAVFSWPAFPCMSVDQYPLLGIFNACYIFIGSSPLPPWIRRGRFKLGWQCWLCAQHGACHWPQKRFCSMENARRESLVWDQWHGVSDRLRCGVHLCGLHRLHSDLFWRAAVSNGMGVAGMGTNAASWAYVGRFWQQRVAAAAAVALVCHSTPKRILEFQQKAAPDLWELVPHFEFGGFFNLILIFEFSRVF